MAQKIIWTEHASGDLGAIVRYIARHNPDAARNMGYGIYDRAQVLMEFPEAGSVVRELSNPDWRQVVFRCYRIVYHINRVAKTVEIVRVWHGARGGTGIAKTLLMNRYRQFVSEFERLLQKGKSLRPKEISKVARQTISPGAPKVLIFSPHPDDECITGGLALRLLREAKWNVINVAVTLGSRRERRAARLRELQNACTSLGFGLVVPGRRGLERINPEARKRNRAHWRAGVEVIARILIEQQPRVIFIPHEHDVHETHIGTHLLVLDALRTLPAAFKCHVVETEFWGQMTEPNLLVESSAKDAAGLVAALACHIGEVRRNAYHARLPAWMMDNVRRGAELVGGQGGVAPDFAFATIYRLRKWKGGRLLDVLAGGKFVPCSKNPTAVFKS